MRLRGLTLSQPINRNVRCEPLMKKLLRKDGGKLLRHPFFFTLARVIFVFSWAL